ncbi:CHAT domain-containing protein, partial [Chloroflexota bacterium]
MLVVISEPHDQHPFGREGAWWRIEQGLRDASRRGEVEYRQLSQPTLGALVAELGTWEPQVLHFVGHGNFYEGVGGVLAFEDQYGATDRVSAESLQQAFSGGNLRFVLLTSCRSGETDPEDDFSGVTQALLKGGIPSVVSMQFSMPVVSGNLFDGAFYTALAGKQAIDEAVASARRELFASADSATARDWGIPVLYLQAESSIVSRRGRRQRGAEQAAEAGIPSNLDRFSDLRCANLLGRNNELIGLARALRESGVRRRFVTVTGLGGIGKTAFVMECARWHLDRAYFPEGVFWASARDASLETLLQELARLLGIEGFESLDTIERIIMLRRMHAQREVLFVIDNADSLRNDADFRRFLEGLSPTARGGFLLTSRQTMGIQGEKDVHLGVIDHASAIGLFLHTWGEVDVRPEQKEHVAAICGPGMLEGHPLAIGIAASVARKERKPDLGALRQKLRENMVETLRDQRTSEEEVSMSASLRLSWDTLDERPKNLLSRVSVYRMPFREDAIDALATDLGNWQPSLLQLIEHHLITRLGDRYYLHPVVQDFAQKELQSPDEVHRRAGAFLIRTEYLEEHLEGIDHLEIAMEWSDLLVGVSAIINQLHLKGYWQLAKAKLEQGLRAAKESGDKKAEGLMLDDLASNYLRRGEVRGAIRYYEQALSIAREIGDKSME